MVEEKDIKDEILELVWVNKEKGVVNREILYNQDDFAVNSSIIDDMIGEKYLVETQGCIDFTPAGEAAARKLIRAHRLAERLLVDVLEVSDEYMESNACSFEHILSPEVTMAICSLLGHPGECPHGKPIPSGECCRKGTREVASIVCPLSDLHVGQEGKVLYISTKNHSRLDQLIVMGIAPGSLIRVHQTRPAYVIQAGETSIALDKEICRDIYMRKLEK